MRFFLALTVTVLGDALAVAALLAACIASLWWLISQGAPITLAALAPAALIFAVFGFASGRIDLLGRWRGAVFAPAGYGPAPSLPGLNHPRLRAVACTAIIAPAVTLILVTPVAILLAANFGDSFANAVEIAILLALLIGAPTLFGVAYASYGRACAEFGAESVPPRAGPWLNYRLQRRIEANIKGEGGAAENPAPGGAVTPP